MTTASGTIRGGLGRRGRCDWELLSAFADGELDEAAERRLESHLAECPRCRADLDGLRRVAARLGRLERQAPPAVLAERVARRVDVVGRRAGLLARVEQALRRLPMESSTLLTFGVIIALAAIVALFAAGVEDSERARRQGAEMVEDPAAVPAGGGGEALRVTSAHVGDRVFDRDGPIWRERGVRSGEEAGGGATARVTTPDDPAVRALFAAEPRLRDLLAGSEGLVVLSGDGEVLRIEPASVDGAE